MNTYPLRPAFLHLQFRNVAGYSIVKMFRPNHPFKCMGPYMYCGICGNCNLETKEAVPDEALSIKALARELNLPERTMYQLIKDNRGPKVHRFGRHLRVFRSDLENWIKNSSV